jgi:hypothetical protein
MRSGKWDMWGANFECNFPAVLGVAKSIVNPITHNAKRISVTDTKAEINQMIAAIEKPIMYLLTKGLADSGDSIVVLNTRTYSITRIKRINA